MKPMNKKTTHLFTLLPLEKKQPSTAKQLCPSESTLAFLRAFASNYHVEMQLPEGLQGIILG